MSDLKLSENSPKFRNWMRDPLPEAFKKPRPGWIVIPQKNRDPFLLFFSPSSEILARVFRTKLVLPQVNTSLPHVWVWSVNKGFGGLIIESGVSLSVERACIQCESRFGDP